MCHSKLGENTLDDCGISAARRRRPRVRRESTTTPLGDLGVGTTAAAMSRALGALSQGFARGLRAMRWSCRVG
jgi:hypothetical protein